MEHPSQLAFTAYALNRSIHDLRHGLHPIHHEWFIASISDHHHSCYDWFTVTQVGVFEHELGPVCVGDGMIVQNTPTDTIAGSHTITSDYHTHPGLRRAPVWPTEIIVFATSILGAHYAMTKSTTYLL